MTILEIIKKTTEYFSQKNIVNPRLNAEQLLCHVLTINRVQLYLQFERILTKQEMDLYRELIRRRSNYEPLQYIIGETEFMSLPFTISPGVFIPRPETEILVEKTLALQKYFISNENILWDIGTGSGCIAVSIAKNWPGLKIIASDVSIQALETAKKNALLNQISDNIEFIQHDILNNTIPVSNCDIIVVNPPYIQMKEYETLAQEIRKYEPDIALTDFSDGTVFYKKICSLTENDIRCKYILFELSGTQPEKIIKIAGRYQFKKITTYADLNGITRVLEIEV